MKKSYYEIHKCDAVVLSCIDFRFWEKIIKFVKNVLKIKVFDFSLLPGACKYIVDSHSKNDLAMKCISVPMYLHHANIVVIVNHADCGAYGSLKAFDGNVKKEQEFYEKELKKAKKIILEKYPDKKVILIFAKLVDDGNDIEFVFIE